MNANRSLNLSLIEILPLEGCLKLYITFNLSHHRSERSRQIHVPEAVAGRPGADEGRVPAEPATEGGTLRSAFGRAPHGRGVAGRIPDATLQPAARKGKLSY